MALLTTMQNYRRNASRHFRPTDSFNVCFINAYTYRPSILRTSRHYKPSSEYLRKKNPVCIRFNFPPVHEYRRPITVAKRFKAWTVFVRSNISILGSDPTFGVDVRVLLFSVCAVVCIGSGLETGSSPSKNSYRPCIGPWNWKKEARAQQRAVEPLMNALIPGVFWKHNLVHF
jgi:hypothetical protein